MNHIKRLILSVLATVLIMNLATADGYDFDNGGDTVEIIFSKARKDASEIMSLINDENVSKLPISQLYKNWLIEKVGSSARYNKLNLYINKMDLVYQEGPCITEGRDRPICYDDRDPQYPKVIISRSMNRDTDLSTAKALIFHEAGHFTGETDHLFLSDFGVEMANEGVLNRLVLIDEVPVEFRGYPIVAKHPLLNYRPGFYQYLAQSENADNVCHYYGYDAHAGFEVNIISSGDARAWNFYNTGRPTTLSTFTDLTPGGFFKTKRELHTFKSLLCKKLAKSR